MYWPCVLMQMGNILQSVWDLLVCVLPSYIHTCKCIIHWMMLIVQYKNDKWASAQREFNNPRICFWAAKREKLITRKYQRLQYFMNSKEMIFANKGDGTNYHCQGLRGARILPQPLGAWPRGCSMLKPICAHREYVHTYDVSKSLSYHGARKIGF